MPQSNQYEFVTAWIVEATADEVWDILSDPLELPRWWPQVYLSVRRMEYDTYELHTRGWLPYTLRWSFRRTAANKPHGFSLKAWGDLTGTGQWIFVQSGSQLKIRYDWRVSADKWILRNLSGLLKPVFTANHRWAMARGEESLKQELLGRRVRTQT